MMDSAVKEKKKKSVAREILEWVLTFVVAVLIVLPFRAFAFEMIRVEGQSMDNTLADGEILLVSKLDYTSVWFSFPWQDNSSKEKLLTMAADAYVEDSRMRKGSMRIGFTAEMDPFERYLAYDETWRGWDWKSYWLSTFAPFRFDTFALQYGHR